MGRGLPNAQQRYIGDLNKNNANTNKLESAVNNNNFELNKDIEHEDLDLTKSDILVNTPHLPPG